MSDFTDTALGKTTAAPSRYTPSLLYPVARSRMRSQSINTADKLPFHGYDLWTGYELTWLNLKGRPEVAIVQLSVPCDSPNIIESKSLKLYLASFTQTRFKSVYDVSRTLESDLSVTAGATVLVDVQSLAQAAQSGVGHFTGECIDHLDIEIDAYQPDPYLLEVEEKGRVIGSAVYSNLLRSLCPVTGQPDIASIQIVYTGTPIKPESLLRYIVSYREHQGFHEHCVESIFMDIKEQCRPSDLSVYARYVRRGGLDISPFRSSSRAFPQNLRLVRQ